MKSLFCALLFALFTLLLVQGSVQAGDNMKAFPPAGKGVVRYVVRLPAQEDEAAFRVQLIAGKTVKTDAVNTYFFGGQIKERDIEGWGFPRYDLEKLGPMAGTLIGVDPKAPMVDRFVTLGGEPYLIRYNSRLPIVVYVPEGVEVRYRVWRAEPKVSVAEKG
jgi:ecotin